MTQKPHSYTQTFRSEMAQTMPHNKRHINGTVHLADRYKSIPHGLTCIAIMKKVYAHKGCGICMAKGSRASRHPKGLQHQSAKPTNNNTHTIHFTTGSHSKGLRQQNTKATKQQQYTCITYICMTKAQGQACIDIVKKAMHTKAVALT